MAVREHTHLAFHSRSEGSADVGQPLKSQLNCSGGETVRATGQDFAVYQFNNKADGFLKNWEQNSLKLWLQEKSCEALDTV